ncbi:hypothetical protein SASPL_124680 [Salvia splendens]|uniref:Uncharacterized protein n=1 Tax=Salvia splendens TaxID=180675 RepID=A0A8X8ZNJ7_SALSN|nr:uncharacterized protein LOC121747738 [Salvia splendens]XP_041997772.1 uncharacterized protein LOC121747738 [Salvia splendens]XP_041997773.1 uncharacterized protein LOC121747738 [Salvia splendens]KAG6412022.1 hypothetical protein SASPL_124680 [Salvia splendens]
MIFRILNSLPESLSSPTYLLMLYAVAWTAVLTAAVAMASFTPEWAFVSAISPLSPPCRGEGLVRLPLDIPTEDFCLASRLFRRSEIDMLVPPLFAAVIVAGSAFAVRALGLWEGDDEEVAPL